MAEFCLDCLNKLDGTQVSEADVILLDDFCEGCGKVAPCVVRYRSPLEKFVWKLRHRQKKTLNKVPGNQNA